MVVNKKVSGKAKPIAVGLSIGVLASIVLTLVGTSVTANLVLSEKLPFESVGYAATIVLLLSSALGAWLAAVLVKRRWMMICVGAGGMYYMSLLAITALFFGGQYQAVGVTALLIFGACGAVGFLGLTKDNGKRKKVKKYRFG
jgi:putative membrane protein (TIGR04086 family)